MDHDVVISSQHGGVGLSRETDQESRAEDHQEALRFALDQLSLMALEKVDCGGSGGGGLVDSLDGTQVPGSEGCNGVGGGGYVDLQMLDHANGSRDSPTSCSPSPEYYGSGGYHMVGSHSMIHGEQSSVLCSRKRSVNMTECVPVPSSEHVAEIVGRQGKRICFLFWNSLFVCMGRVVRQRAACWFFVWVAAWWEGESELLRSDVELVLRSLSSSPHLKSGRFLYLKGTRLVYLHTFLHQCLDNAWQSKRGGCVGGGRGGTGSNKAADCRESGHVSPPAPNKETPAKYATFLNRRIRGGPLITTFALLSHFHCNIGEFAVYWKRSGLN